MNKSSFEKLSLCQLATGEHTADLIIYGFAQLVATYNLIKVTVQIQSDHI